LSTLSVIIITKNEERNIRACLESVQWTDEIIVVDGGSIDRTVDITKEFTQKIFNRPWMDTVREELWAGSMYKRMGPMA